MKKTCNGCRAEEYVNLSIFEIGCTLGYKTKDGKPLEECPKPTTIKAFVRELQKQKGLKDEIDTEAGQASIAE